MFKYFNNHRLKQAGGNLAALSAWLARADIRAFLPDMRADT